MAKNVFINPRGALESGANVGTAFAFRSPKAALSSPLDFNNFYHTRKGPYFGKFV